METMAPIELRKPDEAQVQATTPDQLLALAVDKNLDIDKLEKLLSMKERWEAQQAKRAFFIALSDFQIACPDLRKTKEVSFGDTKYFFAPLADIDRQIKQALKDHGLTKRWEIDDKGQDITVTCIITHVDGHSEKTNMTANPDTSGKKNPIQARSSAITYMQRYTMVGALGLTTADTDMDGRLPELDIDKLHNQYMELYGKISEIDPEFLSKGDPENWANGVKRTPEIYVKAIGRARQLLAKLTLKNG